MVSSSDDALQRARKHLTSATTNSPCAVVIKNGPSAPAADIIVLSREVVKDAPDELRVMLIGCKHHDYESWSRRMNAGGKDVQLREWRDKWYTVGLDAVDSQVTHHRASSTAKTTDEVVTDLETQGAMLKFVFTSLVAQCASPGSTAVPKLSFILQESFAEMPKDLPKVAFSGIEAAKRSSCRVGIRDDLGLFAELFDWVSVRVPLVYRSKG